MLTLLFAMAMAVTTPTAGAFVITCSAIRVVVSAESGRLSSIVSDPPVRMSDVVHKSLKGKVAVVTGASRGIGKGIAITLGERGCTVYITGRSAGGSTTEKARGRRPRMSCKL